MIKDLVKNIIGPTVDRKFIVFSVDDYGNVRNASKKAIDNFTSKGYKFNSIFDYYDALETEEDLFALFEVLNSVRDINNRPACFTPFSLSANIDFENIIQNNFEEYFFEDLITTFKKLNELNTYNLIKEGIRNKCFLPQFHGREHVNVPLFKKLLIEKNESLIFNINQSSFSKIFDSNNNLLPNSIAFYEQDLNSIEEQKNIIESGITMFESVYGYRPTNFMPPSATIYSGLYPILFKNGIKYFDTYRFKKSNSSFFKRDYFFTGKKAFDETSKYFVRNVVFEPCNNKNIDSVALALDQIKAAFILNKPAIISSHRVNFCGRIDENNRNFGLESLKKLLFQIKKNWPQVEFISASELGDYIIKK